MGEGPAHGQAVPSLTPPHPTTTRSCRTQPKQTPQQPASERLRARTLDPDTSTTFKPAAAQRKQDASACVTWSTKWQPETL